MSKYSCTEFAQELERGPYAWPGGYPKFFVMTDGEGLCYACAGEEKRRIRAAIRRDDSTGGWIPAGVDVNWEDSNLFCCHCNKPIESAYGEGFEDPIVEQTC